MQGQHLPRPQLTVVFRRELDGNGTEVSTTQGRGANITGMRPDNGASFVRGERRRLH